jgi:hypothetical protein
MAWAISLLICLVAMLLVPGMTALMVRSHTTGKQVVRLVNAHFLLTLASASVYRWMLTPSAQWAGLRQVVHGSVSDLLGQTCVMRC